MNSLRWPMTILCAALTLTVQATIAPRLTLAGARADWLLVVVVFFSLHARLLDAVILAWVLGFCADLMSVERLGILTLSYVCAAMLTRAVREFLFRDRLLTPLFLCLLIGFVVRGAWVFFQFLIYHPGGAMADALVSQCLWASVYTALWSPIICYVLFQSRGFFGFATSRYQWAGAERLKR